MWVYQMKQVYFAYSVEIRYTGFFSLVENENGTTYTQCINSTVIFYINKYKFDILTIYQNKTNSELIATQTVYIVYRY